MKDFIKKVKKATIEELLDIVIEEPEYLTDSYYYFPMGEAIMNRYEELKKEIIE